MQLLVLMLWKFLFVLTFRAHTADLFSQRLVVCLDWYLTLPTRTRLLASVLTRLLPLGIPLLAASLGPLANVSSIAALVTSWRAQVYINGEIVPEFEGVPFADPRWYDPIIIK